MRSHRKFPAFASHVRSDQPGRFMQYGHERQMSEFYCFFESRRPVAEHLCL